MKILKSRTTFFDVDDTLIMWSTHLDPDKLKYVSLKDLDGKRINLAVHERHVEELLYRRRVLKHDIVVWSQQGPEWAERVVRALKLTKYVSLILEKPNTYFDDLDSSYFMQRGYFKME